MAEEQAQEGGQVQVREGLTPAWTDDAFGRHMMTIALMLARRGLGATAENPSVGAVVADPATGEVIARGWTQAGGRPHAETEALRRAGARARGATLYVTLEPCAHHGGTPPCTDAILAAGIGRVVAAIPDPDPRVAGQGFARLRAGGVQVETGPGAEEAAWIARGHILRMTEGRPFIQLKLAVDANGAMPRGAAGCPVWVTGEEARAAGHLLRAEASAVLVGRRTVVDDDPQLTCRLPGLEARSPIRAVLARHAADLAKSALLRTPSGPPVWVFCGEDTDAAAVRELEGRGAHVFRTQTGAGGRLLLQSVAGTLAANGVTRLLVEGGLSVWRSFWREGLWDEAVLFQAGAQGQRWSEAGARETLVRLLGPAPLAFAGHRAVSGDGMTVFRRAEEGR